MDKYFKERCQLATALRWTARLNMHESVVNHFSLSLNKDASKFLINPGGLHFSLVKASDLVLVDNNNHNESIKNLAEDRKPLKTALDVHGCIHHENKNATCCNG